MVELASPLGERHRLRQRRLAAEFLQAHVVLAKEDWPGWNPLTFGPTLILRPLLPHQSTATQFLSWTVQHSSYSASSLPGLVVDPEWLDIESGSGNLLLGPWAEEDDRRPWFGRNSEKVLLRTLAMAAEGKALPLYADGSMTYIADLGFGGSPCQATTHSRRVEALSRAGAMVNDDSLFHPGDRFARRLLD